MTRDERFQLYERLYFQELERREKISARLSLPFAAVLANIGLLSFMLNSATRPQTFFWQLLFWLFFSASSVALLLGTWHFRKAWYGHTDKLLPAAEQIEDYYKTIVETYKDIDNSEELIKNNFKDFLFQKYILTSSANAINNDQRSNSIYSANTRLTIAVLLALAAAVPFYIGSTSPHTSDNQRNIEMTEPKTPPPPPPPPPPERLVKGDTPKPPSPPPTERR